MLVLSIEVNGHVTITDGKETIKIANADRSKVRVGFDADRKWQITRSNAVNKERKESRRD